MLIIGASVRTTEDSQFIDEETSIMRLKQNQKFPARIVSILLLMVFALTVLKNSGVNPR